GRGRRRGRVSRQASCTSTLAGPEPGREVPPAPACVGPCLRPRGQCSGLPARSLHAAARCSTIATFMRSSLALPLSLRFWRVLAACTLALPLAAAAGEVMDRIARRDEIIIGYRIESPPFSFRDASGQ